MTEPLLTHYIEATAVSTDFPGDTAAIKVLRLAFEQRQKTRARAQLVSGDWVGIKLPRGTVLRGGDYLSGTCGLLVRVEADLERISKVQSEDAVELTRAAYHLGNRHVRVQIGDGWLGYLADQVLDRMISGLGLAVVVEDAPFEPEAGAYHDHR